VVIPAFVPIAAAAKKSRSPKKQKDTKQKRAGKPRLRRLLSRQELMSLLPFKSYSTVWGMMCRGEFPLSHTIGGKVCWYADEIAEYQANLPLAKLKGANPEQVKITKPKREKPKEGKRKGGRRDHEQTRSS
jgi:predicted DNA-binding transcriptional regulator AlpA